MNEIYFVVEEAPEGGYIAKALGESIFTETDTLEELHASVRDAVKCHFEDGKGPQRSVCIHEEILDLVPLQATSWRKLWKS